MNKVADTKRLKDVLQAYGAHQDNWPADEREALVELVASDDPGVQACLQEAREIDFVLTRLPDVKVPSGAVSRILAEASIEPGAKVVDLEAARARRAQQRRSIDMRQAIPVGIAMAASLVLGVLVGLSELTATYVPDTGTTTLASLDEDRAAESLISFEAFTLAEGDVQ